MPRKARTLASVTDQQLREALDGRPVLVTGADGMVGSHMCEKLLELGARVHVLVRATSSGGLNNVGRPDQGIVVHRGDLTDKQAVASALKAVGSVGKGAVIFHLGAQAHVGESWARPYETVAANVLGTLNLLQSIVDVGLDVFRVDVAGSSEEYGNVSPELRDSYRFGSDGGVILDELSPINPQSIYATAKVFSDFITRNFWTAYRVPGVVTRMFNNYGPRQNPRFITGTIITQALSRDIVKLGYVGAKRDFCFVKDGVRGHLHAALFGSPGEVYVYGYGENLSILDWYHLIVRIGQQRGHWRDVRLEADVEGRARLGKSEVEELRVDYSKINNLTGWKPEYDWERGVAETIDWYANHRDRWVNRVDWR
jgi:dTDP-glucose 4,6-dehydratase